MGIFSPSGITPSTASGVLVSSPVVDSVNIVTANTEYSYTFPTGTKRFAVQLSNVATLKVGYLSGGTKFTISSLERYSESSLSGNPLTLYFLSSQPSSTLEILYWT